MDRRLLTVALVIAGLNAAPAGAAKPIEHRIPRDGHVIHAVEYPGRGPALVLMHGFPDDLHLYDRLVPHLKGRRVVLFDFLGWGESDKPKAWAYTFDNQKRDLDAVIERLRLRKPILVAHDASGPPAINWALDHPGGVSSLVLLNTFYGLSPTLTPPEAIAIFADLVDLRRTPDGPTVPFSFRELAAAFTGNRTFGRLLYTWQVGQFITDPRIRRVMVADMWRRFVTTIPAFVSLNRDLLNTLLADTARAPALASFTSPVRIVFGSKDKYLNPGVARSLASKFPRSELFLVKGARHYVQVDEPRRVARLLLSVPAD